MVDSRDDGVEGIAHSKGGLFAYATWTLRGSLRPRRDLADPIAGGCVACTTACTVRAAITSANGRAFRRDPG